VTEIASMLPRQEARGAAWFSVIAPLSYIAFLLLTRFWLAPLPVIGNIATYILGPFLLGASGLGAIAAISALAKLREVGARGVLAPALLGLALNLALLVLAAVAFLDFAGLIEV
jgi:hypothetical protein